MKNILAKLQKPLTRADIDFRVGSVGKGSAPFATILAYKDARTDMRVLDEATDGMWQNEYRRDSKGILQCGIGIMFVPGEDDDAMGRRWGNSEWVWKWSNGMPSNQESEKGEYSDAFKRAGFMWGIGRDLYDVPQLFVTLREGEYYMDNGKVKATSKLKPNSWEWEISADMKSFTAKDKQGVRVSVDESGVPEAYVASPSAPGSTEEWSLERAGATLVSLKGETKAIKDWDASARSWMAEKHANPMVKSAAKYYNEHEVPFA